MSRIILLDSGPLGLITNPSASEENRQCNAWIQTRLREEHPADGQQLAPGNHPHTRNHNCLVTAERNMPHQSIVHFADAALVLTAVIFSVTGEQEHHR